MPPLRLSVLPTPSTPAGYAIIPRLARTPADLDGPALAVVESHLLRYQHPEGDDLPVVDRVLGYVAPWPGLIVDVWGLADSSPARVAYRGIKRRGMLVSIEGGKPFRNNAGRVWARSLHPEAVGVISPALLLSQLDDAPDPESVA